MLFTIFLWLLAWGSLFSGIYNIVNRPDWTSNALWLFQGVRALFPLLALYISLLWIFVGKLKFPSPRTPIGLFFFYSLTGLATSFFSADVVLSLYWGLIFLAVILSCWVLLTREDAILGLERVSYINYAIVISIFLIIALRVIPMGFSAQGRQFYELPFGLGEVNANGVGRFALLVIIISGIRFFFNKKGFPRPHSAKGFRIFPIARECFMWYK